MREWVGQVGGRMEDENNERDTLVLEGVIWGLRRNLVPGKFPGIHEDDPS